MRVEDAPARSPQRVVVDTNVWISASLSPGGAPARLVRCVLARGIPVFSASTFAELEQRLWKPKFDRYLSVDLRRRILHDLNAAVHWIEVPPNIAEHTHSRDPDDDKFIHAALAARARWLVTGDQDLLSIAGVPPDLRVLTPADALAERAFCR